jgi:hypothetical protein
MSAIFNEKLYSPNDRRYFQVRAGAEGMTVQDLIDFCDEVNVSPRLMSIAPESDGYAGPEGPDKYIELDWKK